MIEYLIFFHLGDELLELGIVLLEFLDLVLELFLLLYLPLNPHLAVPQLHRNIIVVLQRIAELLREVIELVVLHHDRVLVLRRLDELHGDRCR